MNEKKKPEPTKNNDGNFWQLKQPFILASASPQRRVLLEKARLVPDLIETADIDESQLPDELPRRYVVRIATEKALAVAARHPNTCVLAADTVLAVGHRIIRKAQTEQEARENLLLISGRKHRVFTGVCIITATGKKITRLSDTAVTMKRLATDEIEGVIRSGEWKGVAGYRIEELIQSFVRRVNGSYSGIIGLPIYEVSSILRGILKG